MAQALVRAPEAARTAALASAGKRARGYGTWQVLRKRRPASFATRARDVDTDTDIDPRRLEPGGISLRQSVLGRSL